jgi:hypothetical protein
LEKLCGNPKQDKKLTEGTFKTAAQNHGSPSRLIEAMQAIEYFCRHPGIA